ncbi:hypothetical protein L7F22_054610 [Adiantum nelumboides]|nr:hypothetical protein [Adiantum nelumboides]
MELQKVELAILCADNLKDVRHLARMQTYAKVRVNSDVKYTTDVDELNGVNPKWTNKFVMLIPTKPLSTHPLTIEIYTKSLTGDRLVGRASIPLSDILPPDTDADTKKPGNVYYANYPIVDQGRLYISYRLMDKVMAAQENSQNLHSNPYIVTRALPRERSENCILRLCSFSKMGRSSSLASTDHKCVKQLPEPVTPGSLQSK